MKTLLLAIATLSSMFLAAPQAEARDRHDRSDRDRGRSYHSHRGHSHSHSYRSSSRVYYSSPRYYYPARRTYYYDDYRPRRYYRTYDRPGLSFLFRL